MALQLEVHRAHELWPDFFENGTGLDQKIQRGGGKLRRKGRGTAGGTCGRSKEGLVLFYVGGPEP